MRRYNEEPYHRQYVDVLALHKKNGTLEIKTIYWPDGREFAVETTEEGPYVQSPLTGAPGKKYVVKINGQKRDIYLQKDRFFVDVPGYGGEDTPISFTEEEWEDIEMMIARSNIK